MSKMAEKDYEIQQTDTDGTEGVVDIKKEMKPKKKKDKKQDHINELELRVDQTMDLLRTVIDTLKSYKVWLDDIDKDINKIKDRLGL